MELAQLYGCPECEAIARTPTYEYPKWLALWRIHARERNPPET